MLVVVFFSPMGVLVFGLYYGFVLVVRKLGLYGCFLVFLGALCCQVHFTSILLRGWRTVVRFFDYTPPLYKGKVGRRCCYFLGLQEESRLFGFAEIVS